MGLKCGIQNQGWTGEKGAREIFLSFNPKSAARVFIHYLVLVAFMFHIHVIMILSNI
jgi:hypothetical protein